MGDGMRIATGQRLVCPRQGSNLFRNAGLTCSF